MLTTYFRIEFIDWRLDESANQNMVNTKFKIHLKLLSINSPVETVRKKHANRFEQLNRSSFR